jgi:hypothetical protein
MRAAWVSENFRKDHGILIRADLKPIAEFGKIFEISSFSPADFELKVERRFNATGNSDHQRCSEKFLLKSLPGILSKPNRLSKHSKPPPKIADLWPTFTSATL